MRKLISFLSLAVLFMFMTNVTVFAQDETDTMEDMEATEAEVGATDEEAEFMEEDDEVEEEEIEEEGGIHNVLKQLFIDGNPMWMTPVLICLIIGLALCIERIITLSLSTTNTRKLMNKIDYALQENNVEEAKEICRSTRGPIASILYQGLERVDEGVEIVEKSLVSYGSVQMGLMERGLVWISLFIAIAPMLGFMGTVIGMIEAFRMIEEAGDISPTIVAGGIKVALLTTVFGLITAVILQIFYNYIVSKVDGIVNSMEDASITFVDLLVKYDIFNKNN